MWRFTFIFILFRVASSQRIPYVPSPNVITEYEWKYFNYIWEPPKYDYGTYVRIGWFNPTQMMPIDVQRSRGKLATIR